VPKNGVWGGVESEDVKIRCSNLQKALPCVNTRLFVYRVSKSVQLPELYVGRKILRTKKERNKTRTELSQTDRASAAHTIR